MRALAIALTCVLASSQSSLGEAQRPVKHARIGVLGTVSTQNRWDSLRQGLSEFGFVEGQNIAIDYRPALGEDEQFTGPARELIRRKVDLIIAIGPAAVRAAGRATKSIPIVALDLESDPVVLGFVESLARPAGNVTGLFLDLPELAGKWLELIREAVPGLHRATVLWEPASGPFQLKAIQDAARSLNVELQVLEIHGPADIDNFPAVIKGRAGAIIILTAVILSQRSARLAELAARNRLPGISPFRAFAEAGGLMAYGPDVDELYRRCGAHAGRILSGAKAGELPVQRPTLFSLAINLRTAKALGLTMPQSLLVRADQVIE